MSFESNKKESAKIKCVICQSCVVDEVSIKDKPKPSLSSSRKSKARSSSPDGKDAPDSLFERFCENFLSLEEKATTTSTYPWRDLPVCPECSKSISSVMDTNSRLEVVEASVRKLEEKLLDELKELTIFVDLLGWQLKKLEKCSKAGSGEGEGHIKDSKKRGKGRPSRKDNERLEASQEVRKGISNITKDLLQYGDKLKDKASWIGKEVFRSPRKRKRHSRSSSGGDDSDNHHRPLHRYAKSSRRSTSSEVQNDHNLGEDGSAGSESSSDSEYLPDSPTSRISEAEGTDDNEATQKRTARKTGGSTSSRPKITLKIKEVVKSEPTSDPEYENDANDEGGANQVQDEVKAKNTGGEKYVLCETSGKIRREWGKGGLPRETFGEQAGSWKEINISEEELKEDYRVLRKLSLKGSKQTFYYCGLAPKHKDNMDYLCPVRIKVKELANGVRVILHNSCEHANHRTESFGLTPEQKLFVEDCLRKGVNKPAGIFESFRHHGLEAPGQLKLQNFLQRLRRKVAAELAPKQEDVGVGGDAQAMSVSKEGDKYERETCHDPVQTNNDLMKL